jgi:hypothetical protein
MTSGGEGEWPTLDELKKVLDVTSDDFDHQLERRMDAAIEQVKLDVGDWDEAVDDPSPSLAEAALLLAVRMAKAPAEAVETVTWAAHRQDTNYQRLLKGHRRRFSIA